MRNKTRNILLIVLIPILLIGLVFLGRWSINFIGSQARTAINYGVNQLRDEVILPQQQDDENGSQEIPLIEDELSNVLLAIEFGDETLEINTSSPSGTFELDSLYSDQPVSVDLIETSGAFPEGTVINLNDENIETIESIDIDNLQQDIYINLTIEFEDSYREYAIRTLPANFPQIEKIGISDIEGVFYTNIYPNENENRDESFIIKMSEAGDILYYKRKIADDHLADFERWNVDGQIRQTYFDPIPVSSAITISGYSQGQYVVMDEQYNVLDTVQALPSENYVMADLSVDHHDFLYLGDNHYMIMKYYHTHPLPEHTDSVDNLVPSSKITAAYLQEIQDDEIIWEWSSIEHPEFYTGAVQNDDYANRSIAVADHVHINSAFIDPKDNHVVASLRNQDSVIKINRDTSEIEWFLGGENDSFGLSSEQMPSRQHHATYTEAGNLILFDNGNEHEQTRILEFELDEENLEVLDFKEFKIDGYFGRFTGSVQKIDEENDVFVIGWGLIRNHYNLMSEIDFSNNEVKTEVITDDLENSTYRFLKYTE